MLLALVQGLFRAPFWNALHLTMIPSVSACPLARLTTARPVKIPSVTSGSPAANSRAKAPSDDYG